METSSPLKTNPLTVNITITANPNSPANLAQPYLVTYTLPKLIGNAKNVITYQLDTATASDWDITGFGGLSLDSINIPITLSVSSSGPQIGFPRTDGTQSPPLKLMNTISPTKSVFISVGTTSTHSHIASYYLQYTNNKTGGVLNDDPEVKCPGTKS